MKTEPACILLAAGIGKRFGGDKMLYELAPGRPMVLETLQQYKQVFANITVVVRPQDSNLKELLNVPGVTLVDSTNYKLGLSQSLIAGLCANQTADGWVIALGDMPYVQSQTISELANAISSDNIVLPTYQGRSGNPVGFGRNFKAGLLGLEGDRGAKQLIQENSEHVLCLPTDDIGITQDIDLCP